LTACTGAARRRRSAVAIAWLISSWLEYLTLDIRYGVPTLPPVFTLVTIVTLTLAIGACMAGFTVLNNS
jgi:hypothetical protein